MSVSACCWVLLYMLISYMKFPNSHYTSDSLWHTLVIKPTAFQISLLYSEYYIWCFDLDNDLVLFYNESLTFSIVVVLWQFKRHRYYHGFSLFPAWISNNIQYKVWGENTYLFPNFSGAAIEISECISASEEILKDVDKWSSWFCQAI